jgi:hypothetical protein
MAIEKKERYVVTMHDGTKMNVLAETFSEILRMYGEENIESIKKMDYEGEQ